MPRTQIIGNPELNSNNEVVVRVNLTDLQRRTINWAVSSLANGDADAAQELRNRMGFAHGTPFYPVMNGPELWAMRSMLSDYRMQLRQLGDNTRTVTALINACDGADFDPNALHRRRRSQLVERVSSRQLVLTNAQEALDQATTQGIVARDITLETDNAGRIIVSWREGDNHYAEHIVFTSQFELDEDEINVELRITNNRTSEVATNVAEVKNIAKRYIASRSDMVRERLIAVINESRQLLENAQRAVTEFDAQHPGLV